MARPGTAVNAWVGSVLLNGALLPLGLALLIIGLMLEAGATGAVKAIKVSAKLLAGVCPANRDLGQ